MWPDHYDVLQAAAKAKAEAEASAEADNAKADEQAEKADAEAGVNRLPHCRDMCLPKWQL